MIKTEDTASPYPGNPASRRSRRLLTGRKYLADIADNDGDGLDGVCFLRRRKLQIDQLFAAPAAMSAIRWRAFANT
jgi:hypothetical protein